MRQRATSNVGRIEKKRNVARNQPVIVGTRIKVDSIKAFHDAGYSMQEIIGEYPTLTAEDIEAALAYGAA